MPPARSTWRGRRRRTPRTISRRCGYRTVRLGRPRCSIPRVHSRHDTDNLPDLRFRVNKPRGRVVWNWEGREYTKYFLPPNLRNTEFTPFSLDCEMHYAGVDGVLLHTDPSLVRDSSYLQEIVERFPGRMYAMAPVEEWRIIRGDRRRDCRDRSCRRRARAPRRQVHPSAVLQDERRGVG